MPLNLREASDTATLRYRAQRRAVWEFAARIENWRCAVCYARIEYEDHELFDTTNLCPTCSGAVNETLVWRTANDTEF